MIEAVGYSTGPLLPGDRPVLAPGGKVALQAITMPHDRMLQTRNSYTWVHKYIFPGGFLPSTEAIESVTAEHTALRVRERLSMGQHYAETLRLWKDRFAAHSAQAEDSDSTRRSAACGISTSATPRPGSRPATWDVRRDLCWTRPQAGRQPSSQAGGR